MADESMPKDLRARAGMRKLGHAALKWYVRHFPISKGKERLVARLWKALTPGSTRRLTVLRQADVRMVCDLTKMLQRRLYFWGAYEEESCRHWMSLAREAEIILDIGANVGLYSLLAASANPNSRVYAFEPTPELANKLEESIRLNGISNIVVEAAAVGNSDRTGYLRECWGFDGTNEGMNYIVSVRGDDSDLPVDVVSLDRYCRRHGIARINLLKMDIEGGEYDALLGARQLLREQAIDCIFLEMIEWAANRSGHTIEEIKELLLDSGYRLYRLRSRRLVPIAADLFIDGENVVAFARRVNPLHG